MKAVPIFAISGLLVVASAVAYSKAQGRLVFRDRKTNPRIQIEGNQGFFEPKKSFELSGNVIVQQKENGLTMTCEKATGDLIEVNGKAEFDNVHLTGGVKADVVGERSNFHATGTKADYDLKDSLRHINLNGNVVLDFGGESDVKPDPKKPGSKPGQRTSAVNVKAPDADVTFRKVVQDKKDILEMQSAQVTGPIRFEGSVLTKVEGKTTHQKFTAKANHLSYNIKGASGSPEVRLTGNLEVQTEDDSGDGPDIVGVQTLVLILNDKQEIVSVRFSSEGIGQIKTTFPAKGKGGL